MIFGFRSVFLDRCSDVKIPLPGKRHRLGFESRNAHSRQGGEGIGPRETSRPPYTLPPTLWWSGGQASDLGGVPQSEAGTTGIGRLPVMRSSDSSRHR